MPMWRWYFYNRSSAVVACASVSRGRRTNPVLTYETALRRFLRCTAPLAHTNGECFFAMHRAVGACEWRMVLSMGDGNPQMKATAEGQLYNHSPRLACLPGVSCGRINLPPKSGCINHGKYFSKLSQPAIGSGVPPAREI